MVARETVKNAALWASWMGAAKDLGLSVRLLIHTGLKDRSRFGPELLEYVVPERRHTFRCNIWNASMLLIDHALADASVTHLMMVSDDTVPVKPLSIIYADLKARPSSRFCTDNSWIIPRAETWWVLRRADAELFHENRGKTLLKLFRTMKMFLPFDCDDETFWYLPLKLRAEKWKGDAEASAALLEECPMFTDWRLSPRPCKAWAAHAGDCNCSALRQERHSPADSAHPATFHALGAEAFRELLRSPFWFARKVGDGAFTREAASLAARTWSHVETIG